MHFAQVPWELQDTPGIDAISVAVYAALQRHADFGKTTGSRVSDAAAAKRAGVSVRTFINRRAKLRTMGWITWRSGKAKGNVNEYVVYLSRVDEGVQQVQTPSEASAHPGLHHVQTTKSQTTKSHFTRIESTTRAAPRAIESPDATPEQGDLGMPHLLELVRSKLYVPDGQAPAGWDISRDGSIINALRKQYGDLQIEAMIVGLSLLRDYPGVYGDQVDWLKPGDKVTLRAINNVKSGVVPMSERARQAYWKHANGRGGPKDENPPQQVAAILRRAMGAAL